ncbi:MAG TPA: ATP-binding protein [Elusimicrobiota bacterium]|nr:ATP-binding protein [Elusimicrobiota bacterium]
MPLLERSRCAAKDPLRAESVAVAGSLVSFAAGIVFGGILQRPRRRVVRTLGEVRGQLETLRRSEERFRAFLTASSDVVYIMSPDWSEMRQLHGKDFIADTQGPSRSWLTKYIHPDDQPQVLVAIQKAIRSKSDFELEHRVIRVNGSLGWTHSRAIPTLDHENRITEWFGTARDVTEHKQAEASLAGERRLYHTILSSTPDLVYVFGLDHRFTYANDALLQMWGKTWEEAIGKTCLELGYPAWHAAMHDRELEEVIATQKPVRGEVPFTGTHGRRIYDYILVPVLDAAGAVEAIAGTTRDVTELRDHASRLEATVAARTAQLKGSMEELERFTYTVAHDLRAPLRAVHRNTEFLLGRGGELDPARTKEHLDNVAAGAKRMDRLIEDLLSYSKIGRDAVRPEPVEVAAVVQEAVSDLAAEIRERRATVAAKLERRPRVMGDAFLLEQVMINLLSNAIKFVPEERRPEIEITVDELDGDIHLTVRDNGIGIEPQHRGKLFRLFERLHGREKYPGTGIGLAIVSKAVERMGGKVGFDSVPGQGSAFWVQLRRAPSP